MAILYLVLAFVFIIGLCIGSFLNVVILRSLSEESIVFPASKCPKCQTPLKWWHNIPVLSYIFLRGKCGFCKEKISIQYPLVELFTAILFTVIFLKFQVSLNTLLYWIVSSLLIVIAVTDIKEKVVFDVHTISLGVVGLVNAAAITGVAAYLMVKDDAFVLSKELLIFNPFTISVIGVFLGIIVMEVLARLGYLFVGSRAFGEGDTYIAAALGAVFGWRALVVILILSVIVQVIMTLPVFIKKLVEQKDKITLSTLFGFIVYAVIFFVATQQTTLLNNIVAYSILAVIFALIGLYLCFRIIKGLKEDGANALYLPFGPAMVISAIIVMLVF